MVSEQGSLGMHSDSDSRFPGDFVRVSHDEVSVSHPDAVKQILLNPIAKVCGQFQPVKSFRDAENLTTIGSLVQADGMA